MNTDQNPAPSSTDLESLAKKGWQLLEQKRYDEAIEVFDELRQNAESAPPYTDNDDHKVAAFQGKIAGLRKTHEFVQAQDLLGEALIAFPKRLGILKERAWLHLEQAQYDAAIEAFDKVLEIHKDESSFLWKITLLRRQRRFEEAENSIREAKKSFPDSLNVLNECGWLQFYQRQYDEALDIFESALKRDQNNESALQGQIATLRLKGQYGEAGKLVATALSQNNRHPGIRSESGWLNFEQGDYVKAEADFEAALTLEPEDPFSHINLAWALVRQDDDSDFEKAARHCREALAFNPDMVEALGCLGVIAFKRGRMREAESYLLRSIRVDPKQGRYADLGALYIQMGRYGDAREKLDEAVKNNPDDAYARIQLGSLNLHDDKIKESIREFHMAMAIDQNNPDAVNGMAIALMEADKIGEADKVLRTAIRSVDQSKRWKLHLTLCQLLTSMGDESGDPHFYEEALKEVRTAIRLKPGEPMTSFYGGVVRYKLEDYRGALKNFQLCLKKDKNHLEAELNARRVRSLIRREKARSRASLFASIFLAVVFLVQLVALWIFSFKTERINSTMLTVLVPILLGLIVVAVLLPWLSRLKLTGLEAELSEPQPKEVLSSGPKGEIGFGGVSLKPSL